MKASPGSTHQPASKYNTAMLISKEELVAEVETVFDLVEEGLDKWQKNWNEEEIFNRITAEFKNIKELFAVVSERSDEFTIAETDSYNKKFYDLYNAVINKGKEYNVLIPWPRRDFGM